MKRLLACLVLLLLVLPAAAEGPARPAPGVLTTAELADFDALPGPRAKLVGGLLEAGRRHPLSRYLFGSADPARGGFDCSGAVYFLLRGAGLEPPRSSAAQFDWIRNAGRLVEVPAGVGTLDDPVFNRLKPGDLLFWGGTYEPTDGRTNGVTHVQIYLGREKKDGLPVMIGSSDGRPYRGSARCGFGVFDFRLPRAGSKSRFLGYGTPPGVGDAAG